MAEGNQPGGDPNMDLSQESHPLRKRMKKLGFDENHASYLVGHAQQMHGPDDFAHEVNALQQRRRNSALGVIPGDDQSELAPNPDSTGEAAFSSGQQALQRQEALSNISAGSSPIIPAPKSKKVGLPSPTPPPMD
jgi:hypothetical protein